ncbi:MAG: 2-oxoisovalerate dehydrogenase E1 subunit beta [Spirochaetaceae bacterium]
MDRAEEIIFVVEEDPEGGYTARALGYSIFTEADTYQDLRGAVRNAIRCHFDDEADIPKMIRLHQVRDEVLPYA